MNLRPRPVGLAASILLAVCAGCASPSARIGQNRAAFDAWPAEVQQKVRAGEVAVGFTPEMVRVALGEPHRQVTRTTAEGTAEVWVYLDQGPKFSFGLGVGSARGSSAYAGGVTVGDSGWRDEEVLRVVLAAGKVTAIERRK